MSSTVGIGRFRCSGSTCDPREGGKLALISPEEFLALPGLVKATLRRTAWGSTHDGIGVLAPSFPARTLIADASAEASLLGSRLTDDFSGQNRNDAAPAADFSRSPTNRISPTLAAIGRLASQPHHLHSGGIQHQPDGLLLWLCREQRRGIYERLIADAARLPAAGGLLVLEIGYRGEGRIREMLAGWSDVETRRGLAGWPRVVSARYSGSPT